MIRKHDGTRPTDLIYTGESYIDTSPERFTHRPSEFFAKHYDNEDPVFNPNLSAVERQSRFSHFKSPIALSKRSLSPYDNKLGSIREERETEDLKSEHTGRISDLGRVQAPFRYSSQVRFSNLPDKRVGRGTERGDSPRSLSRISDSFFGQNRFTNQPTQRFNQRSTVLSRFMEDEIVRLNRYDKLKSSNKKKSLADMVDEVILEKESIYFNPDNRPLEAKEHHFEGDTPSRETVHSRTTFDPYSISPMKERLTSANKFVFQEFWDQKRKDNGNLTFGTVNNLQNTERNTQVNKLSYMTPMQNRSAVKYSPAREAPRNSKIGIERDMNNVEKSHKKLDHVAVSELTKLSNHYYDDENRRITQRYYLILHGDPTAIDAQFSINLFKKSESEKTDVKISLIIRNIFLEYTNDLVRNIAKAVLAYKLENIHNRFMDVVISPDRTTYQRKLEFHTMIMYITRQNLDPFKNTVRKSPDRSTLEEHSKFDADEEWKERKQHKKEKKFQQQLIIVDKLLRNVNFKINFKLDEFKMDALTDIDSIKHRYKRHIFQIKTDPMIIRVLKQGLESGISGFGITFMTRNSLEMI